MKWFKHISDSLSDPFVRDLLHYFGSDGYAVFFGMLEILARETKSFDQKLEFQFHFIRTLIPIRRKKLEKILAFCAEQGRFEVRFDSNSVMVFCPKLKEISDEWTARMSKKETRDKLGSGSGVSPK